MTIAKLLVGGTMIGIATLMTMGLIKTTTDGYYQIKNSNKKYKNVTELEKELNRLGYLK